jgi:hypothetical protein
LQHAFSSRNITLMLGRIAELDTGAEVGGSAWSSLVRPFGKNLLGGLG